MKSVTIKDLDGRLLIKVIEKKDGSYELIQAKEYDEFITIEVRDDKNCKVRWL